MSEYQEVSDTVEVPRGTGIDGFIAALRAILKLPRVQYVNIDNNGRVRFARVVRKGEQATPFAIDLSHLQPAAIIRQLQLKELQEEPNAAYAIAKMFQNISFQKVYPVAFVTNPKTTLWEWHSRTTGIDISHVDDVLYGVPLLFDENIPEYVLVLCASFSPSGSMSDSRVGVKITMPQYTGG